MKAKAKSENPSFRYIPGFLMLVMAVGVLFVYAVYGILETGIRYGGLITLKGIFLLGLATVGNLFVWSLVVTLWRITWRFTFTPTHLIAVHWLGRERIEVPWEAITRVRKLHRAWWARGGGGLAVSQIQTADNQSIPFMTHLMLRYKKFLEELKARSVNCRTFDPYLDDWDS